MAAEMQMTLSLPVGDLSHLWPSNVELGVVSEKKD